MDKIATMSLDLIEEIKETGKVPDRYNMYPEEYDRFDDDDIENILKYQDNLYTLRDKYTEHCSWCLVSEGWIKPLAEFLDGMTCLEIYGGLGLLSHRLQEAGVNIVCTDAKTSHSYKYFEGRKTYTEVKKMTAKEAILSFQEDSIDYIIASWIPYKQKTCNQIAPLLIEKQKTCKMIFIGEDEYGCTATTKFFHQYDDFTYKKGYKKRMDNINSNFQTWEFIHDQISLFKPKRR